MLFLSVFGSHAQEVVPSPAVQTVQREIRQGFERRKIEPAFREFIAYATNRFAHAAERDPERGRGGVCMLSWVKHLFDDPVASLGEVDTWTRTLHEMAARPDGLGGLVGQAATKLDAAPSTNPVPMAVTTGTVQKLTATLEAATESLDRAMAAFSRREREKLRRTLLEQTTGEDATSNNFADDKEGYKLCLRLLVVDRAQLLAAGRTIAELARPEVLDELAKLQGTKPWRGDGITGDAWLLAETKAGKIVLGGAGTNEYRLDEMDSVCMVIDPGGNDRYKEGTLSAERPVLVVIDLAGDDTYRGEKAGIQGGAVCGVSMLVDLTGNDIYEAGDLAQGTGIGGVGMLLDGGGNDKYTGRRRVQGHGTGGAGILVDRGGNDAYRGAVLAQGVGGPIGFGLLDDIAGNDTYYAGGLYPCPYDDSPGFPGWSQGAGIGPRYSADGGIGVLLDGAGDDEYEADYFSHGSGYWYAAGIARDFAGNDKRYGSTRTAFDGSERKCGRFMRYGNGYGCHMAAGFLLDDAGDDVHIGDLGCLGFAWDISVGFLVDGGGNDQYTVTGSAPGQGVNAGLGVCADISGDDSYTGGQPGYANPVVEYHKDEKAGGNFSFLLDLQGNDKYQAGLTNSVELERGWAGGFFIDR